ncbi:MAG: NAD-dependent epimerase/dehydratase family protein [Candidatus Omnitrophica bacterium]|nr:NAD-dependent epimerase/dehydratase family protein [Candidatus Omnitrophota bacterium]
MIKTIAVSGGTGFLGHRLVKDLLKKGYMVRCLTRYCSRVDFCKSDNLKIIEVEWNKNESLRRAVKGADAVIHCAAIHPARTLHNKEDILKFNIDGTKKLLECLDAPEKFIMVSSMRALINSESGGVFNEDSQYDFREHDTPYGYSKFFSEKVCFEFSRKNGLPLTVINPTPIIGPEDVGPSPNGEFILGFLKSPVSFTVKSNYSFVDVRDVSMAILKVLEVNKAAERYVLCSANWPLRTFIRKIQGIAHTRKPILEIPLPLAYMLGGFFECIQNIKPDLKLPVTRASVEFASLNPVFKGDKIKELGISYTDPDTTLKEAVEWLIANY